MLPQSWLGKLGYHELILKCGGELALKSLQEEVKRTRAELRVLEHCGAGDSQSNGAAEKAVQA